MLQLIDEKKYYLKKTKNASIGHADANAAFNIAQSSEVVLIKDRDLIKSGTDNAQLDMVKNAN